jgi:hypothetical protein
MAQVARAAENHNDARLVVVTFLNRMQMIEFNASICAHSHKFFTGARALIP